MKIGLDARIAYYSKRGIGVYANELIGHLLKIAADEHEFILLKSIKDKDSFNEYKKTVRIKKMATPAHNRFERILLPLEMSKVKMDIFHHLDLVTPLVKKYKTVLTIYDLYFLKEKGYLEKRSQAHYGQIAKTASLAKHIITTSENTKKDVIELLQIPENKISVTYLASRRNFFKTDSLIARKALKEKYGIDKKFILAVGAIEPRKNLQNLISAYKKIRSGLGDDHLLIMAGEKGWEYSKILSQIDKENLKTHVLILDYVSDPDLNLLYNTAQALAYISYYEGFGLPPLEAFSCQLPVVASNTSCFQEVLKDAAILTDPFDSDKIAQALYSVLTDTDLRQNLIRKGLEKLTEYSWDKTARKTLEVYKKIS